jgi:hypothetical protein
MSMTAGPDIAFPDTDALAPGDGPSFRRILVPIRLAADAAQTLAVAASMCSSTNGVLCLLHVRIYDPPLRGAGRFYPETRDEAAAVPDEALLMLWAYGAAGGSGHGHRPAGGRLARRRDRDDAASHRGHLPRPGEQRARPGHAQGALPGARRTPETEGEAEASG